MDHRGNKRLLDKQGWVLPDGVWRRREAGADVQLVDGSEESEEMLDRYNFFILPIFNVDGYHYTWKSSDTVTHYAQVLLMSSCSGSCFYLQRLHRKSMRNQDSPCHGFQQSFGVDLNRNFPAKFYGTSKFVSLSCRQ